MTPTDPTDLHNQRLWERLFFEKRLSLLLPNGRVLSGTSLDVSIGGVFLVTDSPPTTTTIPEGTRGTLSLTSDQKTLELACTVVRVLPKGVALKISDSPAIFGIAMSQDIFSSWEKTLVHTKPCHHPTQVGVKKRSPS